MNPPPAIARAAAPVAVEPSRDLPLLDGLDPAVRAALLSGAGESVHAKGAILFREGERADRLFVLLDGSVELFARAGGREAVILVLTPPDLFVAAAALSAEPYLVSARALTRARVLTLDADQVRREVARCPALADRFVRILSGHFRTTVRQVKDLKLRSGVERLGAYLLRLVNESGRTGYADLPIPKGVLASRLGLTAATLSRALRQLEAEGMVVRGRRVVLRDRDRFERFCGPDPLIDGRELALGVRAI